MKRETHPEAYDHMATLEGSTKTVDDMPDELVIGTWEACAYIREIAPEWEPGMINSMFRRFAGKDGAEIAERRRKAAEPERAETQYILGEAYRALNIGRLWETSRCRVWCHFLGVEPDYWEAIKWLLGGLFGSAKTAKKQWKYL
jgi:hypothetical protein